MGRRNPDNIRMSPSPMTAITLAEIRAAGWKVRATCRRCGIGLHVDLGHMAALLGHGFILWGRHPRCRVWTYGDDERCGGLILFEARAIQGGTWRAMTMTEEVRTAIDLRSQMVAQARPSEPTSRS